MHYRLFPGTKIRVSEIGYGMWTLASSGWGEKTDAEAIKLLRRAFDDYGINYFDAADVDGNGRSERQLADAFRGRRDQIIIGTKIGYDIYDEVAPQAGCGQGGLKMRADPGYLRFAVDKCLERLKTDHIDVLRFHDAKMEHVRDPQLWQTLRDLKQEGKIRAWGAAFGPAIGWLYEATELVARERDINTVQMIWNVLEQHPGTAIIAAAKRYAPNCCFSIRVTHASGLLEGRFTRDAVFPEGDHRRRYPRSWLLNGLRKLETLTFLTTQMTLGQAALKWLLTEPSVVTALPDICDGARLDEFARASEKLDLSPGELSRIARLNAENFGVVEPPTAYEGTTPGHEGRGKWEGGSGVHGAESGTA